MTKLIAYNPDDRVSARQALRHTYFRELRQAEKKAASQAHALALASQNSSSQNTPRLDTKVGADSDSDMGKSARSSHADEHDAPAAAKATSKAAPAQDKAPAAAKERAAEPARNASPPKQKSTEKAGLPQIHKDLTNRSDQSKVSRLCLVY
jgi:hypothetical protein